MSSYSLKPEPRPGIEAIEPYVPGKSKATAQGRSFKLSANENALGAGEKAIAAFQAEAQSLAVYPDGAAHALRAAIAQKYSIPPENIVCGCGSDELLHLLASGYLRHGDEALYSEHGFLVYKIATLAAGATPVLVPERDLCADVDALLGALTGRTRIVFLANPNNPTGTYLDIEQIKRLHAGLPDNVLLVLDAAYAEFVQRNDYDAGIDLVRANNNVVMTRTFSKIHGLAALRLGWAYCPEPVAAILNRLRGPFNVNRPALAAGVAALNDTDHIDKSRAHNTASITTMTEGLQQMGIAVTPSVGNFLLLQFAGRGVKTAERADAFLLQHGLVLRAMHAYGLPNALRLTIGTNEANDRVLAALKKFMAA